MSANKSTELLNVMETINFNNSQLPSCTGSIDTYINHVMSIPALSTEEEVALAKNLNNENY